MNNVREKKSQKSPNCGLGLAAVAVGIGAGAVLYYFWNKRPQLPDLRGATSANWQSEPVEDVSSHNCGLDDCSICCEVMVNPDKVTTLPCQHKFHCVCITPWLLLKRNCPNCRCSTDE